MVWIFAAAPGLRAAPSTAVQWVAFDAPQAPDEHLLARDREARVSEAIKTLPLEQSELLRQAFYLAKSHSEIATEMKLPLGTVKSRLRLAFGRLRKVLEGEDA